MPPPTLNSEEPLNPIRERRPYVRAYGSEVPTSMFTHTAMRGYAGVNERSYQDMIRSHLARKCHTGV